MVVVVVVTGRGPGIGEAGRGATGEFHHILMVANVEGNESTLAISHAELEHLSRELVLYKF